MIQVNVSPALSADDLRRGLLVTVDGRRNLQGERIQASQQGPLAATVESGSTPVSITIDPIAEVYFNDDADLQ